MLLTIPENVTTIRPGDTIVTPLAINPSAGLPGIPAGTEVKVEKSFEAESPKYWILHLFVPGHEPLSRSTSLNVDMLVQVVE